MGAAAGAAIIRSGRLADGSTSVHMRCMCMCMQHVHVHVRKDIFAEDVQHPAEGKGADADAQPDPCLDLLRILKSLYHLDMPR